jgi:exodeoxyribonuclease VII large subunit
LFPAVMQGSQAEASIIDALDRIYLYEDFFDVVVIIRGGGSQIDLSCFDNYNLAYYITQFPLPVITGIGHEKDNTIVDLVAHTRLKTPTAVAEFLIGEVAGFDLRLEEAEEKFFDTVREQLEEANQKINQLARLYGPLIRGKMNRSFQNLNQTVWQIDHLVKSTISNKKYLLDRKEEALGRNIHQLISLKSNRLKVLAGLISSGLRIIIPAKLNQLKNTTSSTNHLIRKRMVNESHSLELAAQKINLIDPKKVLARGYSITIHNGKILKDNSRVFIDDTIKTILYEGTLISKVLDKNKINGH